MANKNLTPFLFGSKVTSRRPPQPEMTLIVRAKFTLRPGAPLSLPEGHPALAQETLRGDVFRDDDHDMAGECLYPSDLADFKPHADVLLLGTCHTPGKARMTECPVRFGVGSWSKILRVVGDRVWMDGLLGPAMSDPVPFDRMPLGDRYSFGGPGHPLNPVGKGHGTRELPNVENADDLLLSRSDRPAPAGFGPLSPNRPDRRARVGKQYGKSYREKRAPYYAEDFDWTYFNAAPPDQWLPYLRGDEELLFQNLHPDAEVFRSQLPGLRIRVFVKDAERGFREVPMHLDTLLADLDKEALYLTWRGLTEVTDDDLSLTTTLVASEPLDGPSPPQEHYREILERFEADPLEIEQQIAPELKEEWKALQALARKGDDAAPADASGLDPLSALLKARLGDAAKPQQDKIRRAMAGLAGIAVPGGKALGGLIAEALRNLPRSSQALPPPSADARPAVTDAQLRTAFRRVARAVEEARSLAAARGAQVPALAAWDKLASDPKLASMGLSTAPPRPPGQPGPGSDLSEQDLSEQDLSGVDLTGANLTGAILTGANLRGAKLAHATLKQAVLFDADVRDADFTGADLSLATLQSAWGERAVFRGATLEGASFDGARLMGADLSESQGAQIVFSRADMTGATARGAKWTMAFLEGTALERADFSQASLMRCFVSKVSAASATFAGTTLIGTSFSGSDLREAVFAGARGEGSVWLGATVTGADFSLAVLTSAHFTEAVADGASFFGANARGARFDRANLTRADFTRANLFDADLHKSLVPEAKFVDANLYDAKFYQTSGSGCDFRGANLKRSTLERDR
ncbi:MULTISPECIES: DUF2169 domain-containing protein [Sorangium]|uniref:DUF2169 domain-containing protein n=1 Tax=Sorangium cellulosum TaxID=56 RepID=A0A4P2QK09_SORCE|nr:MULTISPECIES: DUF2169 domain-containing protein [Sorangium]AUX30367.1 hypothetical protein SOCE836_024700 [Sorangium cellulosum]WCQ89761.1 hypothetical protein NQZ70_02453 [Sorangium sp. Soce836]